MASRFLTKSKFISKFSKELRAFSVLYEQQNNNNKKLKLVVSRQHKGSDLITLLSIGDNDIFANFPTDHFKNGFLPAASCNNKLLLHNYSASEALWDPTTGELKTLPPSGPVNHSISFCFYGFGFDPKAAVSAAASRDYKVIRVVQVSDHAEDYHVELYSLKTDSWKQFPYTAKYAIPIHDEPSLYINGFYYWSVSRPDQAYARFILRFDFANEKFCSPNIPLPDIDIDRSSDFILVEFEGSLAVLAYSLADELADDHEKPFEFVIWVWNDESLSWAKRVEWVISVPSGSSAAGFKRPLGLFNNDQLYLRDFMGELVLFNCATGELKNLGLKSDQMKTHYEMAMFAYFEEVKQGENEKKIKIGTLFNSTTFISKLAPIVNDSTLKPNNSNKPKLLIIHGFEETLYLSQINSPPTDNNDSLKDSDNSNNVLFNFPRLGAHFIPTASCNSALLLCCVDSDRQDALWNPTTDEVKKLPDSRLSPLRTVLNGFGFDPKAEGDYKVIRVIQNRDWNMQAELYSLKADSWKDITLSFPFSFSHTQHSFSINGFCYMVDSRPNGYIVSFDFANEIFSYAPHIPLPPPNYNDKQTFFHNLLAEFHGSLAALVYYDNFRTSFNNPFVQKMESFELEIWVWNNDESSWSKVSTIHLPSGVQKPLGLFGNDQLYLQGPNGEVSLFDCTKGGELKRLGLNATGLLRKAVMWRRCDYIFPYVESSFPLNGKKIIRASHKIIND